MSELATMKDALVDAARDALESNDLAGAEKALSTRKQLMEVEKLERDRDSDRWKFWVTVLAPLVTAAALIATLIVQGKQFAANMEVQNANTRIQNENSKLQRESKEDEQYREALKTIQRTDMLYGITGIPLLKSFLDSPRYQAQTREVIVGLLPGVRRKDHFESLFEAVVSKTGWKNFSDLVRISAGLEREWSRGFEYISSMQKLPPDQRPRPDFGYVPPADGDKPAPPPLRISIEESERLLRAIEVHQRITTGAIARFLRQPRPQGVVVDLADASLWKGDFSEVDLSGAILNGTALISVDLRGADLSRITEFKESRWDNTAWWRAKAMSPELVEALHKFFAFSAKQAYENDDTKSRMEYQNELKRLRAAP